MLAHPLVRPPVERHDAAKGGDRVGDDRQAVRLQQVAPAGHAARVGVLHDHAGGLRKVAGCGGGREAGWEGGRQADASLIDHLPPCRLSLHARTQRAAAPLGRSLPRTRAVGGISIQVVVVAAGGGSGGMRGGRQSEGTGVRRGGPGAGPRMQLALQACWQRRAACKAGAGGQAARRGGVQAGRGSLSPLDVQCLHIALSGGRALLRSVPGEVFIRGAPVRRAQRARAACSAPSPRSPSTSLLPLLHPHLSSLPWCCTEVATPPRPCSARPRGRGRRSRARDVRAAPPPASPAPPAAASGCSTPRPSTAPHAAAAAPPARLPTRQRGVGVEGGRLVRVLAVAQPLTQLHGHALLGGGLAAAHLAPQPLRHRAAGGEGGVTRAE